MDLIKYLAERGHEERRIKSFIKNLKKDGLLDVVEETLSRSRYLRKFIQIARLLDSSVSESENAVYRLELMLQHLLGSMVEDEFYNKKFLINRRMFLSSTIQQYERRFQDILNQIDRVMRTVSTTAAEALKKKAGEMREKINALLERMDKLGLEPEDLRQDLLRVAMGLDSIVEGDITPENIFFYVENLPQIASHLEELEERCNQLFQRKEKLEAYLERITKKFDELKRISEHASETGLRFSFIEEYVNWKDVLISRIRDKCKKAGPECFEEAISSAKELEEELSQLLEQSETIESMLEKKKEISNALKEIERDSSRLDSLMGTDFFSKTLKSLKDEVNSLSEIESILDSSELDELVKNSETILRRAKLVAELGRLMKEFGKLPEETRNSPSMRRQVEKMVKALESELPFEEKVSKAIEIARELIKGARATEEVLQDLLRLYPIWRRRILSLVREKGSASIEELRFIPPRWRMWVVNRIVREVEDISLSGDRLVLAGALTPLGVRIEVARQKAAAFEEVLRGLEEFLGTELEEERRGLEQVKQMISSLEDGTAVGESGKTLEEVLIEVNRTLEQLANMLRKRMAR